MKQVLKRRSSKTEVRAGALIPATRSGGLPWAINIADVGSRIGPACTDRAVDINDWIEKPVDIGLLIEKTQGWATSGWRESVPDVAGSRELR